MSFGECRYCGDSLMLPFWDTLCERCRKAQDDYDEEDHTSDLDERLASSLEPLASENPPAPQKLE